MTKANDIQEQYIKQLCELWVKLMQTGLDYQEIFAIVQKAVPLYLEENKLR